MRTYKCRACHLVIAESDKNWDLAVEFRKCPKCGQALTDEKGLVNLPETVPSSHAKPHFKKFLLFVWAGPLIGAIPFSLALLANPAIILLAVAGAYVLGIFPAIIAGSIFNLLLAKLEITSNFQHCLYGMLSGFSAALLTTLLMALRAGEFEWMMLMLIVLGAVAGGFCGYQSQKIKLAA